MNILNIINEEINNYKGEHEAPTKEDSAPLYDLTKLFPDDIYSSNALRMYGTGSNYDYESMSVILSARNKPNKLVRIYRAVPDFNYDISKKIKDLSNLMMYYHKYHFFPINNSIINDIQDKIKESDDYDYLIEETIKYIQKEINNLNSQKKKGLSINNGDWVTTSRLYAKEHGISNLNNKFKILSKVVKASQLYNEGNDINEWGYVE